MPASVSRRERPEPPDADRDAVRPGVVEEAYILIAAIERGVGIGAFGIGHSLDNGGEHLVPLIVFAQAALKQCGVLPQGVVAVIVGSGVAQDVPWAGAVQLGVAAVLLAGIWVWTLRTHRNGEKH